MRPALYWLVGAAIALSPLVLAGCGGGGWTPADAASATDAVHGELLVERICAPGAGCAPAQVRALERMAYCGNASMLARHGEPTPDAGIQCQAQ